MGQLVFKIDKDYSLKAGDTSHIWWNNATPINAVWTANAVPLATGDKASGFNQDTQLEVTRLWRRFKVVEKSTTQFSDVDIETEIHVEVKNLGNTSAKFNLYFRVDW